MKTVRWIFACVLLSAACAPGVPAPAPLDTRNETCGYCRMPVSDPRLAAQIAAPAEEPRFFDDLGCLRDFLSQEAPRKRGAVVYVADHRTGEWTPAELAVFSRCPSVETPMGSHLLAHAGAASRAADPAAGSCTRITATEILGSQTAAQRTARR